MNLIVYQVGKNVELEYLFLINLLVPNSRRRKPFSY